MNQRVRLTPFGWLVVGTFALFVRVGSALLATVQVWWPMVSEWLKAAVR